MAMDEMPEWTTHKKSACIQKWTDNLHNEAKRLIKQDGTHGNMVFCFDEKNGLIAINAVPPKTNHDQVNISIINAVKEHNLYGIIFIGETWAYFIKEKDHTAFQILTGEMNVVDLREEDKKAMLMVRMEKRDGDCLIYVDEIIRDEKGITLKERQSTSDNRRSWFVFENQR